MNIIDCNHILSQILSCIIMIFKNKKNKNNLFASKGPNKTAAQQKQTKAAIKLS